jgi:ribonuclease HII
MHALICGVDEAGRGPLAGPVYAAAVVLNPRARIDGLADSKVLSERTRELLAKEIMNKALAWVVTSASVQEIDELNILQATMLAMKRAIDGISVEFDEVQVDGNCCPSVNVPIRAIVRGDATVEAISAASILAKTARDAEMLRLHQIYPGYGLDRHKGYPTKDHISAITLNGVLPIHRRTFGPVKRALLMARS